MQQQDEAPDGLEARIRELDNLRNLGLISDDEYAASRRAALGLGPVNVASSAPVEGTTVVTAVALPTNPTMPCRCSHTMQYYPNVTIAAAGMPVLRGRYGPMQRIICCKVCRFLLDLNEPAYACGNQQCLAVICQRCVASGAVDRLAAYGTQYHSSLVGGWCSNGAACFDSLCYNCFDWHLMFAGAFVEGESSSCECGCYTCVLGSVSCCEDLTFFGLPSLMISYKLRQNMMELYGLEETGCQSCCSAYWCKCCSSAQVYREMKFRGHDMGGLLCIGASEVHRRVPAQLQ